MLEYGDKLITAWKDSPLWWHERGLSFTRSGYGSRIPSRLMVRIGSRWHRVYIMIYSNSGTAYIFKSGRKLIITLNYGETA